MKVHISDALAILGIISVFYAASVGDGGGPWSVIIIATVLGCVLTGAACWIENRR